MSWQWLECCGGGENSDSRVRVWEDVCILQRGHGVSRWSLAGFPVAVYCDIPDLMNNLQSNYVTWKEMEETAKGNKIRAASQGNLSSASPTSTPANSSNRPWSEWTAWCRESKRLRQSGLTPYHRKRCHWQSKPSSLTDMERSRLVVSMSSHIYMNCHLSPSLDTVCQYHHQHNLRHTLILIPWTSFIQPASSGRLTVHVRRSESNVSLTNLKALLSHTHIYIYVCIYIICL